MTDNPASHARRTRPTSAVTVAQLDQFDEIIDVRSESEFAEDHIPGAVNFPVLNDAERAAIGDLAKVEERGTAFGWYNMMLGIGAIPAGLAFGWIWARHGASAAWIWAAIISALSALLLRQVVAPRLRAEVQ